MAAPSASLVAAVTAAAVAAKKANREETAAAESLADPADLELAVQGDKALDAFRFFVSFGSSAESLALPAFPQQ